uniref:Centromere/kinetochore protein zw10 middle domain-containing protein n=1 Tax=Glossina palpalis gambiensis TaxID=67801 RepID=A0A1B0B263_9MUSC
MTGNLPSGSNPFKVYASVWQMPVAKILMRTSCELGGSTSISSITRGFFASQATAALQMITLDLSSLDFKTNQLKYSLNAHLLSPPSIKNLQVRNARYHTLKICDFLFLKPMVVKSVSVELLNDNEEYSHLNISYSLKELMKSLSLIRNNILHYSIEYFANINLLLDCLRNINVNVNAEENDRLLKLIVDECLMDSVPATMDEYHRSALVQDVSRFEQVLVDYFFIHPEIDCTLTNFTKHSSNYFVIDSTRKC